MLRSGKRKLGTTGETKIQTEPIAGGKSCLKTGKSMPTRRFASDSWYLIQKQTIYSGDNNQSITLEVTDTGGVEDFMAMTSAMAPESEKDTDHGYDKTCTAGGNLVHEEWDSQSKSGEYSVIVG